MESIQLAQMLADLSDLNAAEAEAAMALINANKTLAQAQAASIAAAEQNAAAAAAAATAKHPEQRNLQRVASSSAVVTRTSSPAMLGDVGRRLLTPPITRSNSAHGSIPGTPRRESEQPEGDIDRATTLMQLYEIRAKLKQQDNTSILKAREKIAALAAKQQAQMMPAEKKTTQSGGQAQQHHYTFPRGSS